MVSFFFSSRRRHTRCLSDWSSDVCSSDLALSVSSCRASSAETDAGDRRQGLRQRSVARAAGTARNRTDRAASLQPQETGDARWPSAAAVPTSLDRRTHQRLARKLPPLGGALRPLAHDLSRVLSYRLLHDRLTEGCAIASSNRTASSDPKRGSNYLLRNIQTGKSKNKF